ncbi:hypothetical protein GCM10027286_14100 [Virgibacillus ainsalahensis]
MEVLVVLGVLSILLFLSPPLNISSLEKHQTKQFLETFEYDVLYIQNLATTTSSHVRLIIRHDRYTIVSPSKTLAVRYYPSNLEFNSTMENISFTKSGSIRKAGNITINTLDSTYKAVFPPGKGRFYIYEN